MVGHRLFCLVVDHWNFVAYWHTDHQKTQRRLNIETWIQRTVIKVKANGLSFALYNVDGGFYATEEIWILSLDGGGVRLATVRVAPIGTRPTIGATA